MSKTNSVLVAAVVVGCVGVAALTGVRAANPAATPSTAPTTQKVDPKPVNKMCAVETDQPIDPSVTVVYDGKTYAFCCKDCVAKFKADPEKYAANAK
jgi:YHS domain-containing protein